MNSSHIDTSDFYDLFSTIHITPFIQYKETEIKIQRVF